MARLAVVALSLSAGLLRPVSPSACITQRLSLGKMDLSEKTIE